LVGALIWAPSAGNLQSRKFYFVFNNEIKKRLVKEARVQSFITQAPLVMVACTDDEITDWYGKRGRIYSICGVTTALQNLMLVAQKNGLGSCWLGAFDDGEIINILNLPENLHPIAVVPVGYPAEKPSPPPRVSKQEAVEFVT